MRAVQIYKISAQHQFIILPELEIQRLLGACMCETDTQSLQVRD